MEEKSCQNGNRLNLMSELRRKRPTSRDLNRDRRVSHLSGILLFFCIFIASAADRLKGFEIPGQKDDAASATAPTPANVSRAIALAAWYMERACGPDGK